MRNKLPFFSRARFSPAVQDGSLKKVNEVHCHVKDEQEKTVNEYLEDPANTQTFRADLY